VAAVDELADADAFAPVLPTDGSLAEEPPDLALVDAIERAVWGQGFPAPVFCDEVEVLQQRLLKDKLGADLTTAVGVHRAPPVTSDILHALLALGYSEKEAVAAVKQLPEGLAVADGIRQALKLLAKP
jgi:single-stranded DNA-specific DHH superfamily exonuclease